MPMEFDEQELISLKDRILKRCELDPKSKCMMWKGSKDGVGFGRIHTSIGVRSVHRVMFMADQGEIDPGMLVYHTCGERCCVEPTHLYLAPLPSPGPRSREEQFATLPKGIQKMIQKKEERRKAEQEERRAQGVIDYQAGLKAKKEQE